MTRRLSASVPWLRVRGVAAARAARCGRLILGIALIALGGASREVLAQTQAVGGTDESRALREAETRLSQGDLAGAEAILLGLLSERPTSLGPILELEKVLRLSGGLDRLIEPVQRLLATDRTSAIGQQMLLRTLSNLDRVEELKQAGEDWIRGAAGAETPYRELARIWEDRGDVNEAIRTLRRGREQLRQPGALALELGELYARLGDNARAAAEWDTAIGPEGRGLLVVRRRLAGLPDGGAAMIPGLVDRLTQRPGHVGRRRAAIDLALRAGLESKASPIAKQVYDELRGAERDAFVLEMAYRADDARLPRLAHWAYTELVARGGPADQRMNHLNRLAELSWMLGDTVQARESFATLERGAPAGSSERRQATAMRIQLTAREGSLEVAVREVQAFRQEFADAPELDDLAAAVAAMALQQGELDLAAGLVTGLSGPRSGVVRGQLALRRGELTDAQAAFMTAAQRLRGEEAIRVLGMATLLTKLTPGGGTLVGRAMELLERREPNNAVRLLADESQGLSDVERAAILDFAAGIAERNHLQVEAELIRRSLVTEYPKAQEAPAALLALARSLGAHPDTSLEARELLERLILEYPRSALVPQARRELDRLRAAGD